LWPKPLLLLSLLRLRLLSTVSLIGWWRLRFRSSLLNLLRCKTVSNPCLPISARSIRWAWFRLIWRLLHTACTLRMVNILSLLLVRNTKGVTDMVVLVRVLRVPLVLLSLKVLLVL
jgi:hypothetical protein